MRISPELQADNLKKVFLNLYNRDMKLVREAEKRFLFERASNEALEAGVRPEDVIIHKVTRTVVIRGRQETGDVSILAVKFQDGSEAAWVALLWFKGGWVETVRVFTKDTANMPWLDDLVRRW